MKTFSRDVYGMEAVSSLGRPASSIIDRCVEMALTGITREFPCQFPLTLTKPGNFHRPRELTPVFYGCYDWHSAVHNHWLLVRALAVVENAPWRAVATELLTRQLDAGSLLAEAEFLADPARTGFERPYGLAWLLQLDAELSRSAIPEAREWRQSLQPLTRVAVDRFRNWFPQLGGPIRTGEHSQTAFAMGLIHDWARTVADPSVIALMESTALRFHSQERNAAVHLEPSAHDFLSPSLAVADLMRRVLSPPDFANWLHGFYPAAAAFTPVSTASLADGKLAHFAGLNFSRGWMMAGIAASLPDGDPRIAGWQTLALEHIQHGLAVLDSEEYAVTHWIGSFVMYALTGGGRIA
jgi:Protein of unknown function (DUF2891)